MKKLFFILVAFIISAYVMAEGHLKFKGVEMTGTPQEFVQKLKDKGLTFIQDENGTYTMLGEFATFKDCVVAITTSDNKVVKVSVIIPDETLSWNILYGKYVALKEMLTSKYGAPKKEKEEWQNNDGLFGNAKKPTDDNSKIHELMMNRARIGTIYEVPEGIIELTLFSMDMHCCVLLNYYDAINQKTLMNKAINDL